MVHCVLVFRLDSDAPTDLTTALANKNELRRDFQHCDILKSVDLYEPVQPPFKLRNYKLCSVSSLRVIEYSSD